MNTDKELLLKKALLLKEKRIRDCKKSFYEFCKVMDIAMNGKLEFFLDDRPHLKKVCDTLQQFHENKLLRKDGTPYQNLSISLPPSHGKSFMVKLFSAWVIGNDYKSSIITASYNEDFAISFSKTVREIISIESKDELTIGYNDIFPEVKIKQGSNKQQEFTVEGSHFTFKSTSPNGGITGIRANRYQILDDIVKDAYEAMNQKELEKKYDWWRDTFRSRITKGCKRINIGTRWSNHDPLGKIIATNPDAWYNLSLPACLNEETGEMLCESIFDYNQWLEEKSIASPEIFYANYQQQPMEYEGRLYTNFKEYTKIPKDEHGRPIFEKILSFTDNADKGTDYHCSIVAGLFENELYILDVLYTQESTEVTEKKLAELLHKNEVNEATIESNAGGSIFARNVEKLLRDKYNNHSTTIKQFHQSKNKEARILSTSSTVERIVYFPYNWGSRWSNFYLSLISFQREFKKNRNDDSADALTGLCELVTNKSKPIKAVPSLYSRKY